MWLSIKPRGNSRLTECRMTRSTDRTKKAEKDAEWKSQ